jgi:hypothetical protein
VAGLTMADQAVLALIEECPRTTADADMQAVWAGAAEGYEAVRLLGVSLRRLQRRGFIRDLSVPGSSHKLWMRA